MAARLVVENGNEFVENVVEVDPHSKVMKAGQIVAFLAKCTAQSNPR